MNEQEKQKNILERINWKEEMWPIDPHFLNNIPTDLLPEIDKLNTLTYPWELLVLLRDTLPAKITESRISESAQISDNAEIVGPVWIESGCIVRPFSVIIGPAYIGKNTIIDNYTVVNQSVIGNDVKVGERTSIESSVIGNGCHFHANYVGDSLLSQNIYLGGRTSTANRRTDRLSVTSIVKGTKKDTNLTKLGSIIGPNTRFAGNCLTMPGVKIGKSCVIGPKSVLYQDLSDNRKTKEIQQLQITNR